MNKEESKTQLGHGAKATGENATAIGAYAKALAPYSVAAGAYSAAKAAKSVALGRWSSAEAENSVAIGSNAIANAEWSVAIGSASVANEERTVSFGCGEDAPPLTRRLVNVAEGTFRTDAATMGQLNDRDAEIELKLWNLREAIRKSQEEKTPQPAQPAQIKKQLAVDIIKVLSAVEAWSFGVGHTLPDYLHDQLQEAVNVLGQILLEEKNE